MRRERGLGASGRAQALLLALIAGVCTERAVQ